VISASEPDASWFRHLGLGVFIHWGHASTRGWELSWQMTGGVDRQEPALEPVGCDDYFGNAAGFNPERFDPAAAAAVLLANAQARGAEARATEEARISELDLSARDADQRVKRAARGAEREELLAQLEELGAWYRDLVAVAVGAESAAIHLDNLAELRADATRERIQGAERAAEAVRETWRSLEELNLAPQLAFEALFVRVARELRT